jgi:hypothetical protein
MMQLTLRTLLAYIDDTLEPADARTLGKKVADNEEVKQLVERIKRVTRRRGLAAPETQTENEATDPNTVAAYLDNALDSATIKQVEETCLESDVHLAEVAAIHQILTLVLTEPVRVPPRAHKRMYGLVKPPASMPDRRPNKTLPIGGAPPAPEHAEADDADAALLLGMKRYSAANTWAARFALFGAAAVLLILLTGAVLLSLQRHQPQAPEVAGPSSWVYPVAPVVGELPKPKEKEPEPIPLPKPKEPDNIAPPMPEPRVVDPADIKPFEPVVGLGDPIPPPSTDKPREIAQVRQTQVLVVTQPNDKGGLWERLRLRVDDAEGVQSNTPVMALPGYKADLVIDRRVQMRLWGNVPEQLPYRVLESRVKIHNPPVGFDADITLLAGRIYLKSDRIGGAKIRLRVVNEVWDITLPDAEANVLAELISWFEPGTMYARTDGSQPKREARFAVAFGSASFAAPLRFKKFEKMLPGQQVNWDSTSDALSEPRMIDPEKREELLNPDPTDPLKGDLNKAVTRILSAMAGAVQTREAIHPVVKNLVGPDLPPEIPPGDRDLVARLAIYSHAALADSTKAGAATLTPLIDVLRSQLPWLARQAVVTALVNWVARDRGNTALLHPVLTSKGLEPDDADWLLRLLRGYVSPTRPNPKRLDELVETVPPRSRPLLGDPEVAIREAALWNIMVVRLESWVPLPLGGVNVGAVGAKVDSDDYRKFLSAMKADVEALKKKNQHSTPPK